MMSSKDNDLLRFIRCIGGHSIGAISGKGANRQLRMHTDDPASAWNAVRGREEATVYVLTIDGWVALPDPRNKETTSD